MPGKICASSNAALFFWATTLVPRGRSLAGTPNWGSTPGMEPYFSLDDESAAATATSQFAQHDYSQPLPINHMDLEKMFETVEPLDGSNWSPNQAPYAVVDYAQDYAQHDSPVPSSTQPPSTGRLSVELANLKPLLTCDLCQQQLCSPMSLPCFHTFCARYACRACRALVDAQKHDALGLGA